MASLSSCKDMLEFAAVTQFLNVFKGKLRAGRVDASVLETALVQPLAHAELLERVHVAMLRVFTHKTKGINGVTWARKLLSRYKEELEEWHPRDREEIGRLLEEKDDTGTMLCYQMLPLRTKVLLLHELCTDLCDVDVIRKQMRELGPCVCRAEPVGCDTKGRLYWNLATRLYREVPAAFTGRFHNRKMQATGETLCIATTLEEWEAAIDELKSSAEDRALATTLEKKTFPPVQETLMAIAREDRRRQRVPELPTKRSHRILEKELVRKAEEQEYEQRRAARAKEMVEARRQHEQEEEYRLATERAARLARRGKGAEAPMDCENSENYPKRRNARRAAAILRH
mmetsp:Transcript_8475/g.35395  ORF Transcript_8475/g.35395 Transcript_8475/m.35395 type:complete len:343 (+) Transcript_8475:88-1116(+)